jgi:hypothetical protein
VPGTELREQLQEGPQGERQEASAMGDADN